MVINDFEFEGVPFAPLEAQPRLQIYPDTEQSGTIPMQRFQPIRGGVLSNRSA
jgi:hypothetical protein